MKKLSRNLMIFVLSIAIILSSLGVAKFDVNAASASFDTTHEFYLVSAQYPTKSVNVYVDKTSDIQNKTAVNLYATDKSATQRFKFVKNSKGNYLICPTGSNYTVNVSALSAGTAVFTWENKAANNEYFIIGDHDTFGERVKLENILGKLAYIVQDGKKVDVESFGFKFKVFIYYHFVFPLRIMRGWINGLVARLKK